MKSKVTNVVFAGLGGQGVLKASDILADAAFRAGYDVKKAEVHGMSQRGGSVTGDVRFGKEVFSPMVPFGEADFLVALDETQIEPARGYLRAGAGTVFSPSALDRAGLPSPKTLNTAMLGLLSADLDIPEPLWLEAIQAALPECVHEVNIRAFRLGRSATNHTGGKP